MPIEEMTDGEVIEAFRGHLEEGHKLLSSLRERYPKGERVRRWITTPMTCIACALEFDESRLEFAKTIKERP